MTGCDLGLHDWRILRCRDCRRIAWGTLAIVTLGLAIALGAIALRPAHGAMLRAAYRDVSVRIPRPDAYRYLRGVTATQADRYVLQETHIGDAIPAAIRVALRLPRCHSVIPSAVANLNATTARLGNNYRRRTLTGGGVWTIPPQGRYYSFPSYTLAKIQACALADPVPCATVLAADEALWDLLDVRVERGRCVRGAPFVTSPHEPYDPRRAAEAPVDSRLRFAPLTASQLEALHATHTCHAAVTRWRCRQTDDVPKPACDVDALHQAFEATATTESDRNRFTMLRFSGFEYSLRAGYVDGWTDAEVCRLAVIQDRHHARWMDVLDIGGDWDSSDAEATNHQNAHICMGLPPRLGVRVLQTCGPRIEPCQPVTCAEVAR